MVNFLIIQSKKKNNFYFFINNLKIIIFVVFFFSARLGVSDRRYARAPKRQRRRGFATDDGHGALKGQPQRRQARHRQLGCGHCPR